MRTQSIIRPIYVVDKLPFFRTFNSTHKLLYWSSNKISRSTRHLSDIRIMMVLKTKVRLTMEETSSWKYSSVVSIWSCFFNDLFRSFFKLLYLLYLLICTVSHSSISSAWNSNSIWYWPWVIQALDNKKRTINVLKKISSEEALRMVVWISSKATSIWEINFFICDLEKYFSSQFHFSLPSLLVFIVLENATVSQSEIFGIWVLLNDNIPHIIYPKIYGQSTSWAAIENEGVHYFYWHLWEYEVQIGQGDILPFEIKIHSVMFYNVFSISLLAGAITIDEVEPVPVIEKRIILFIATKSEVLISEGRSVQISTRAESSFSSVDTVS